MQRRIFLQRCSAAAATAAAGGLAVGQERPALDPAVIARAERGVTWHRAPCRFCGVGCGLEVGVREGRVVAVAGDPASPVNRGLLCAKGYHAGMALYGRDRLTQPMLRRDGSLVPVSWDEAIDTIAGRLHRAPSTFAMYGSGQWTISEGYVCQKLMKAGLGNNHIEANARLCTTAAVAGRLGTYGSGAPAACFDDLDTCDVLITWGTNAAETHPVLFSRALDRGSRGAPARVIDVSTRRTRTSELAGHHVRVRPGADIDLLNGIAHLLVRGETYDASFVQRHCSFRAPAGDGGSAGVAIGFDEYRRRLAAFTPARVEAVTGVSTGDIRMLARLFGERRRKITTLWCAGVNQRAKGTAVNQLLHSLHLLSGHWGRPGDGPQGLTGQPSTCGTVEGVGTLAGALPGGRLVTDEGHRRQAQELWGLPRGRISARPGHDAITMWKSFSTPSSDGGDIDTLWVQGSNPAQSLPDAATLFDPSRHLDEKFLIVSDVVPTATTREADLVLPSAMWIEKDGAYGSSERRTQRWSRMVEPPGDARDDTWQVLAVARRLYDLGPEASRDAQGSSPPEARRSPTPFDALLRDARGAFLFHFEDADGTEIPVWDWGRFRETPVDALLFEEYRRFCSATRRDLAPYGEYDRPGGLRWPVVRREGRWRETPRRFVKGEDPYVDGARRVRFYHSTTGDDRAQIWLHDHWTPAEIPDTDYPFWLSTCRALEHAGTGSVTMRMPPLRHALPRAYVEMHLTDGRRLGLVSGDRVALETRRGRLELPVWIDGRGAPPAGSVFVPLFDEAAPVARLMANTRGPASSGPDLACCAARILPLRAERSEP